MKQRLLSCLICAALLLALCPAVSAAGDGSGFYNVGGAAGVEISPLTPSGAAVSGVERDADGDGVNDVFYPGSGALRVALSNTVQGKTYILIVSSSEKTFYVDQQTGGGALSFRVSFALPDAQTELTLEIGSTEAGFEKKTVTLFYTPSAPPAETKPAPTPSPIPTPDPIPTPSPIPTPDPIHVPDPTTDPGAEQPGYALCKRGGECPMAAFTDVDPAAWYHDGVHYVLENGIMNGVGNNQFSPSAPTSRGMIVTILWHLEGAPDAEPAGFGDVTQSAWYAKAVNWAASEHLVEGYSAESFGPNDNITREQLALILLRYAKDKNTDQLVTESISLGTFVDAEHISGWAFEGVQWAVNAGLISGTDHEHLSPKADASRSQVATILMRYSRLK